VHAVLDRHGLEYEIKWHRGGEPFLTGEGRLRSTLRELMRERCGVEPRKAPGAAPPMRVSSRPSAPKWSKWARSTPASTRWTNASPWAELEALPALFREMAERLLGPE
jgi:succinyl-diaminopimelate desuccinylase